MKKLFFTSKLSLAGVMFNAFITIVLFYIVGYFTGRNIFSLEMFIFFLFTTNLANVVFKIDETFFQVYEDEESKNK